MAKEYTIPQLLGLMQIRGYSPRAAEALHKALNTRDQKEYNINMEIVTKEVTGYNDIQFYEDGDQSYGTNALGLPIYRPLIFDGVPEIDGGKDLMLEAAIVNFDKPKDIEITKIKGQKKSVKEHINDGDYHIQVSGMISKRGIGYPSEQVKKLQEFMDLNQPLAITHDILNQFGITHIVITKSSYKWTSFMNAQVFSFTAIDDEPLLV